MAKVLVTGGYGYIGSHTIFELLEQGHEVICADNFNRSDQIIAKQIEQLSGVEITNHAVDLCDLENTRKIFEASPDIDGVIHFAAYKSVPESVAFPLRYYHNNLNSLINVLHFANYYGVKHFIFSSSCSVYGNIDQLPVTEETPLNKAQSPYAHTKQVGEDLMRNFASSATGNYIALRYFNPVGAHESGEIGELPIDVPNNLVPRITQAAAGLIEQLTIFGSDYETRDGTCVRDYVHVSDIAKAHIKALDYSMKSKLEPNFEVFNLGSGIGVTVYEAIQAFIKTTSKELDYTFGERRAGDVAAIYSDNDKATKKLNWKPEKNIDDMMRSAWKWQEKLANLNAKFKNN